MARTVNAGRTATTKNAANGHAGVSAFANALELNLGMARNVLDSSFAALHGCLQYVAQAQQASAETVKDLSNVLTAAVEEAEYATNFPEFLAGCRALTAGELMSAAQSYSSLLVRLSEVEARLIQQAHAAAASRSIAFLDECASQWRGTRTASPR